MGVLARILGVAGLASAGHLDSARARAEKAEARLAELKTALASARDEVERVKEKSAEQAKRLVKAEEASGRVAKAERELEQVRARDEKHLAQLAEMRERVERAERAVALSREHLMATETKLDIIEGAISVLDSRTRT